MRVIWKYDVTIVTPTVINMPKGAKILTAQAQTTGPCVDTVQIWAAVDPEAECEPRRFIIIGTGREFTDSTAKNLNYIGTAQTGIFVWHVFEDISIKMEGQQNG